MSTLVDPSPPGGIQLGTTVRPRDLSSRQIRTWTVVASVARDAEQGKLSIDSPVAKALLGRAAGDEVSVATPRGVVRYVIEYADPVVVSCATAPAAIPISDRIASARSACRPLGDSSAGLDENRRSYPSPGSRDCRPAPTASRGGGKKYQPFPSSGPLVSQLDLSLEELVSALDGALDGPVYIYVVETAKWDSARFVQVGNSPNFQGGVITLCACKHWMRARRDFLSHRFVWVAGVTSELAVAGRRSRHLFYLMLVRPDGRRRSQAEIWESLPRDVREAKSASLNLFGDLYEPLSAGLGGRELFRAENYYTPCHGHGHHTGKAPDAWREDIDKQYGDLRPDMLKGDPAHSYLWTSPHIRFEEGTVSFRRNARGHRMCWSKKEFIENLGGVAI
jgi:hypothetical protein